MKSLILFFALIQAANATTYYCNGRSDGNLHLTLDLEGKNFSFAQFCWNPCNMGGGKITAGPFMGWSGIRYRIELTDSEHLISPIPERAMTIFFDFDMKTATLSGGREHISLECTERED